MMNKATTAAFLIAATATGASASTLADFTDSSVIGVGPQSAPFTVTFGMRDLTFSSIGGDIVTDDANAPGAAIAPLVGDTDGLGVLDGDEVTLGNGSSVVDESITIDFSGPVRVAALYFTNLFALDDPATDREEAIATFMNGGEVVSTFGFEVPAGSPQDPPFGFVVNTPLAIIADSVTFTVGAGNDGAGRPDYSVAGIEFTAVPLPAAAWMLLSALGGITLMGRRRRTAA